MRRVARTMLARASMKLRALLLAVLLPLSSSGCVTHELWDQPDEPWQSPPSRPTWGAAVRTPGGQLYVRYQDQDHHAFRADPAASSPAWESVEDPTVGEHAVASEEIPLWPSSPVALDEGTIAVSRVGRKLTLWRGTAAGVEAVSGANLPPPPPPFVRETHVGRRLAVVALTPFAVLCDVALTPVYLGGCGLLLMFGAPSSP